MSSVFTGAIYKALKSTLDNVIGDKSDGYEAGLDFKKWCEVKSMNDNWEEDQEYAGPGLAAEVPEGDEIPAGTIREGATTRYLSRKFGLRLVISEEAIEDNKYDKVIDAAKRLKRALYKTADIDAHSMLVYATSTSRPGGDGLPLASASHPMPHGGTYSNVMSTPMSPSRMAVIQAVSQIKKLPGHDGITEGYQAMKVLCPTEQWAIWEGLLGSDKVPESNANEINVVKRLSLSAEPLRYWDNTTSNWAIKTDCEHGLQFRWRRKPRDRNWVENSQELMSYAISARWATGFTNPRALFFVDA